MTDEPEVLGGNAQSQLRSTIERLERLEDDKAAVLADIKEVLGEAKGNGFAPKILRKVVALRRADKTKLAEDNAILDLYMTSLGEEMA